MHFTHRSSLQLDHWQAAYEETEDERASFMLLDGDRLDFPPGTDDKTVAGVFGEALRRIVLNAMASGSFESLQLADDCQLDIENFDWMWSWPELYEDAGTTNLLRDLAPKQPPKSL